MAKRRIPTKPSELRDQLTQAATGIGGEANWPATAPILPEVSILVVEISSAITQVDGLKPTAYSLQSKACPDGAEKNNFGLTPKKTTPGGSEPLDQIVIVKTEDGTSPASILVDWDTEAGAAAYQVEWYTDSAMTQQIGNAAVSESEYEIAGLIAGQQYWIRVRAIRGGEYGPWSDPATRVANI